MITVTLHNPSSKIGDDHRTIDPDEHANTYEAVAKAAIEMIKEAGELYVGDAITITAA